MEKIFRFAPALCILFGLSACLSEPLSRNCVRILFLLFFAMLWKKKFSLRDFAPYTKILFLMAIFVAWLIISYVEGGMSVELSYHGVEWIVFSHNMIIFLLFTVMVREEKILRGILIALAISLMIDNFHVFWQAAQGVERPITFLHGSVMQSTLIYLILLPTFLVLCLSEKIPAGKIFYGIIFVTSLVACIMINTRGAWLDLAIVLPVVIACHVRNRRKFLAAMLIFVVAGGIFLSLSPRTSQRLQTIASAGSEQSVTERFLMWRSAIDAIIENPLTGVGFGNYEAAYQEKYMLDTAKERSQGHAHNIYLQLWAEAGLPGLIFLCGLFGYILRWSWLRVKKNFYALIIFAATLDFLLYGMTDYALSAVGAMRIYWLVFAVCVVGIKLTERKNFSL